MPEIVEVMTTNFSGGGYFTVNLALDSVPLEPMPAGPHNFVGGSGSSAFESGDNIIILSAGYILPESFVMSQYDNAELPNGMTVPTISLLIRDVVNPANISQCWPFGHNGIFRFPFANYEIAVGTFFNPRELNRPGPIENAFYIQCDFPYIPALAVARPNVSMQGVPAALDGITYQVPAFIKVMHNLILP